MSRPDTENFTGPVEKQMGRKFPFLTAVFRGILSALVAGLLALGVAFLTIIPHGPRPPSSWDLGAFFAAIALTVVSAAIGGVLGFVISFIAQLRSLSTRSKNKRPTAGPCDGSEQNR
jgi:hypothetical protein